MSQAPPREGLREVAIPGRTGGPFYFPVSMPEAEVNAHVARLQAEQATPPPVNGPPPPPNTWETDPDYQNPVGAVAHTALHALDQTGLSWLYDNPASRWMNGQGPGPMEGAQQAMSRLPKTRGEFNALLFRGAAELHQLQEKSASVLPAVWEALKTQAKKAYETGTTPLDKDASGLDMAKAALNSAVQLVGAAVPGFGPPIAAVVDRGEPEEIAALVTVLFGRKMLQTVSQTPVWPGRPLPYGTTRPVGGVATGFRSTHAPAMTLGDFVANVRNAPDDKLVSRLYSSMMKPPKSAFNWGATPVEALKKESFFATSYKSALSKVDGMLTDLEAKLQAMVKGQGSVVDIEPLIKNAVGKIEHTAALHKNIPLSAQTVTDIRDNYLDLVREANHGSTFVNAEQLLSFKRDWSKLVNYKSQDAVEIGKNKLVQAIARAADKAMDGLVNTQGLNQHYSSLLEAKKSLETQAQARLSPGMGSYKPISNPAVATAANQLLGPITRFNRGTTTAVSPYPGLTPGSPPLPTPGDPSGPAPFEVQGPANPPPPGTPGGTPLLGQGAGIPMRATLNASGDSRFPMRSPVSGELTAAPGEAGGMRLLGPPPIVPPLNEGIQDYLHRTQAPASTLAREAEAAAQGQTRAPRTGVTGPPTPVVKYDSQGTPTSVTVFDLEGKSKIVNLRQDTPRAPHKPNRYYFKGTDVRLPKKPAPEVKPPVNPSVKTPL